ncbi:SCO4225 family membrane protein [Actinacidiphila soli]|jgi:hypothetical protein|uniref:SCO4225 family membrane protein n=1 Tax=Actinacidiphila soli TaxID=2487275 RepID=UPI000FCC1FA4|nr:hypothetical protein [Actinacidiphila soli]
MRVPPWLSATARSTYRERAPRVYLCLVAAALFLLLIDTAFISHQDASFLGIWLLLLTLPWAPMLWALFDAISGAGTMEVVYGWGGRVLAVTGMLVAALINAVLLGVVSRYYRERRGRGVVRP